jgi:metallo-beta-lactamase class B
MKTGVVDAIVRREADPPPVTRRSPLGAVRPGPVARQNSATYFTKTSAGSAGRPSDDGPIGRCPESAAKPSRRRADSDPGAPAARCDNFRHARSLTCIAAVFTFAAPNPPHRHSDNTILPNCAEWNAPQHPFRVFGNTYFVGTHGLSAILVTSPAGHIVIDGGLAESAPLILAHIRELGFRVEDVKLILNSHDHYDHAAGIAAIQRASGATVAASPSSARVLEAGASGPDDPQFGVLASFPPVKSVRVFADGDTLRVGPLALAAHSTGGHTPGGTSWSWRSCEGSRCLEIVYADSQTPVSADGFFYTKSTTYPAGIKDFERGFAVLETLQCDILVTPHPGASALWERLAKRDAGDASALIDSGACRRYAATARQALWRIATKRAPCPTGFPLRPSWICGLLHARTL